MSRIEIIIHDEPAQPAQPQGVKVFGSMQEALQAVLGGPELAGDPLMAGMSRHDLELALKSSHEQHVLIHQQLAAQSELLQSRTIERDHFKQDSHLWGLIVAWLVDHDGGEEGWQIESEQLKRFVGRAINGHEENGIVTVTLGDIVPPSDEVENG